MFTAPPFMNCKICNGSTRAGSGSFRSWTKQSLVQGIHLLKIEDTHVQRNLSISQHHNGELRFDPPAPN